MMNGKNQRRCADCRSFRLKARYSRGQSAGYCIMKELMPGLDAGYETADGKVYGEVFTTGVCQDYEEKKTNA